MAHEAGDKERRRHRRRRTHASSSNQRHDIVDEERPQAQIPDDAFERPVDQAALREARLKAMETPTTARKKMKLEYRYIRPVKTPSAVKGKPASRSSPGLLGRRSSTIAVRPKSTASKNVAADLDDDGEYVYGRPPSIIRRDFQREHDRATRGERRSAATKEKPAKTTTAKPKTERRRSEPSALQRRDSISTGPRATVRKSSTSVKTSKVEPITPSALSHAALVEPGTPRPSGPTRKSSLFSSLLPAPKAKLASSAPSPKSKVRLVSCLTCGSDDIPPSKSAKLPCTHRMCHSCLRRLFKLSLKDPAHMPPRCCTKQDINLQHVDKLFSEEFKKTWNRKYKEYNAKNRLYCPKRGCGEWIQEKYISNKSGRRVGTCPKCKVDVCGLCGMRNHRSRECPQDPAIKDLEAQAEKEGWRRCYNCNALVELKEGCNHMTCRCLAEFCMVCGVKWKGCDCPWFDFDAVNDGRLGGDPIRYQQEMDRRREQERRDEEVARRMAGLAVADGDGDLNQNFLQQAREALTANYQNAELAARGLLGGWLNQRQNALGAFGQEPQLPGAFPAEMPRRRTYRVRGVRAQEAP